MQRDFVEVWLDAAFLDQATKVGVLFCDRGHLSFAYDKSWLESDHKFNIDPGLGLYLNDQPALDTFGIFTDSAPDRWGRVLMDRRELADSKIEKRNVRALHEWDYLTGVQDETRMGAIRLRKDEQFIDNRDCGAPPVTSLSELQHVASLLENEDEENMTSLTKWLSVLIAPGSSLGGARPKANFRNTDGSLWIAKFPKQDDKEDIGLWEGITLELAKKCGINVPEFKVVNINGNHHTFLVKRFDRTGNKREMFVSAMTMLQKKDNQDASYLDIAEFIQSNGRGDIDDEIKQLWRRMVFNVMVSNRDDHLRNHGFLRDSHGWYLSPAYDLNPNKEKHTHSICLNYNSAEPSFDVLFESIDFLRLDWDSAAEIVKEVHQSLASWRDVAKRFGAKNLQIELMSPAFNLVSETLLLPERPPEKVRPKKPV
jgi:serine/threonine-protein kinase HipA